MQYLLHDTQAEPQLILAVNGLQSPHVLIFHIYIKEKVYVGKNCNKTLIMKTNLPLPQVKT